jgi:hypothetical protein
MQWSLIAMCYNVKKGYHSIPTTSGSVISVVLGLGDYQVLTEVERPVFNNM